MTRFLIVGSGGRESAFATSLLDVTLYAVISHKNKTIIDCVNKTGGKYTINDPTNPDVILDFAKKHEIDYVFVNADEPLANGVVDILIENDIKAIGGTRNATQIEWDKIYAIQMMKDTCPEFTPFYKIITSIDELKDAINEFKTRELQIAVKPQGLTGGKGVKVMPEHLETYQDCIDYATILLERDGKVLLVEKLHGIEFTIMGITDGKHLVMAPASYDYPFRFEGDKGAGTGGMGCFTDSTKLPFMNQKDMDDCKCIMQRIIDKMRNENLNFTGVLNGGFFKTKNGIKFMEFNSRFGDPECLNILSVLNSSFSKLLVHLWNGTLSDDIVTFMPKASVVKYLVAKEYPNKSLEKITFTLNEQEINKLNVKVFFAACVETGMNQYQTLLSSRVVGFSAVSDTISEASLLIDHVIDNFVSGKLEYRRDIGSKESIEKLMQINSEL